MANFVKYIFMNAGRGSLLKYALAGFLIMQGAALIAAPQISISEAEEKIVFASPQTESLPPVSLPGEAKSHLVEVFDQNNIDVASGQPLPGITITLLIGAAFCSFLRRRWKRKAEKELAGAYRKSAEWTESYFYYCRKSICFQLGTYCNFPIELRL